MNQEIAQKVQIERLNSFLKSQNQKIVQETLICLYTIANYRFLGDEIFEKIKVPGHDFYKLYLIKRLLENSENFEKTSLKFEEQGGLDYLEQILNSCKNRELHDLAYDLCQKFEM